MRIPDPKANTTTEAYLAYKAGYLEESELKPVLYEPYLHFDGWLAYWAGLTATYPVKNVGKNLFDKNHANIIKGYFDDAGNIILGVIERNRLIWLPCKENTTYTIKAQPSQDIGQRVIATSEEKPQAGNTVGIVVSGAAGNKTFTTPKGASFIVIRFQSPTGTDIETLMQGILDTLQIEEGSSASAYESYTGEPEMLTDEEALVAYLSGVTDTYPEEIKDPYDVRIVGYLKYLVSARWGRPEYPVNNEEFYLSTMKPPVVPSGDTPSSDIEMGDTAEAPFIDLKMYGDTRQNSYTGKNLSPYPYYSGSSSVARGITFTAALDGSITINGSNDGTGNSAYFIYNNDTSPLQLEAGTYYFIPPSDANVGYVMYDGTSYYDFSNANNYSLTFSSAKSIRLIYVQVRKGNTAVFNNSKIYPMLTTLPNPTESDYEPYVGGVPAPNPDYPQEIQTVTGEQTVNVHGENLLNLNITTSSSQGVTLVKNENDIITVTGTSLRTGSIPISPASVGSLVLENGETYTQRFEVIDGELPGGVSVVPSFVDSDGNIRYNYFTNNSSVTTESEMTCNTYNFYWKASDINFNFSFRVWLEKNNDLSSEYSPYQSQSYPISLGSIELCKIGEYQDYIYKSGDDWYVHKEIGEFDLSAGVFVATTSSIRGLTNVPNIKYAPNNQVVGSALTNGYRIRQGQGLGTAGVGWFAVDTSRVNFNTGSSTNPVGMLYYALATPTNTKITDSTLIGQFDALMEGGSYEDKTFIKVTATDPNLPGLLYVEAGKYD